MKTIREHGSIGWGLGSGEKAVVMRLLMGLAYWPNGAASAGRVNSLKMSS